MGSEFACNAENLWRYIDKDSGGDAGPSISSFARLKKTGQIKITVYNPSS